MLVYYIVSRVSYQEWKMNYIKYFFSYKEMIVCFLFLFINLVSYSIICFDIELFLYVYSP